MSNVVNWYDKLKQKLEEDLSKLETSSSSDIRWAYPQEGVTLIRVLPNPTDIGEPFWRIVRRHKIPHPEGKDGTRTYVCMATFGKDCPLCALSEALMRANNDIEKQLGKEIRAYTRIYVNAILKGWKRSENEQTWTTPPGMEWNLEYLKTHPVVMVLPYSAGDALLKMINQNIMMLDPENGFDVMIVRRRSGNRTEYSVIPIMTPSPIENYEEVMRNAYDLETVLSERDPFEMASDAIMGMIGTGHTTPIVLRLSQQWGVNTNDGVTQPIPPSSTQAPPPITPPPTTADPVPKPDHIITQTQEPEVPPTVVEPPKPEVPTPPPPPPTPDDDIPTPDEEVLKKLEELKKKFQ